MKRRRGSRFLLVLSLCFACAPALLAEEPQGEVVEVQKPTIDPEFLLPRAQPSVVSGLVVGLGSALTLGGLGLSSYGLYQSSENLGGWKDNVLLGGAFALGGFLFILIGGLATAPYDQVPVSIPQP